MAAFIFVVDGPNFETKAVLLAGSLRKSQGPHAALYAYCPNARLNTLTPHFLRIAKDLGVNIVGMDVPDNFWTPSYPHGNKIFASLQKRPEATTVFLDTDIMVLEDLSPILPDVGGFTAVPEGVRTWAKDQSDWDAVYSHFDLPIPTDRVRLTRGKRLEVIPYYNAGLISWTDTESTNFSEIWLDTAKQIDSLENIPQKRPWLDQIALPVAVARSGFKSTTLPEHYNFSFHRRKELENDRPAVAHFHTPREIMRNKACRNMFDRIPDNLGEEATESFMIATRRPRKSR